MFFSLTSSTQAKEQKIFCDALGNPTANSLTGKLYSAIGCIPINEVEGFVSLLLPFGIGLAGGIAILLIVVGGLRIMSSSGNPEGIKSGKDLAFAGMSGLLLLLFSVFVYRLLAVDILRIPGF